MKNPELTDLEYNLISWNNEDLYDGSRESLAPGTKEVEIQTLPLGTRFSIVEGDEATSVVLHADYSTLVGHEMGDTDVLPLTRKVWVVEASFRVTPLKAVSDRKVFVTRREITMRKTQDQFANRQGGNQCAPK